MESKDEILVWSLALGVVGFGIYFGTVLRLVPLTPHQTNRDCVRMFLMSTTTGVYLEVLDSMISFFASITYVADTYVESSQTQGIGWSMIIFCADSLFTIFFSYNFALQFYIARNRFKYLFTREAFIDFVTIVPIFVTIVRQQYPFESSFSFFRVARLLKVARVFRLFRLLRSSQIALRETKIEDALVSQIIDTCAKFLCLVFITSGLTQAMDRYLSPRNCESNNDISCGTWRGDGEPLEFHDALYFIVVTLSTVGYGDISPSEWKGRLFICVTVFAFIFFLPTESNRISRLMGLRSKYLGSLPEVYYGRQLIIGCNPTCCAAVETLLQEIFHEDHGLRTEHAVILCPSEPDLEWGSLLLQYASRDKLSFLRGDVQTPGDLRRAGVEYAKCVFILSDRNAVDTRIEDTRTLIRVLTVNECNRHIPIFAQVIHKDSRERVMSLGLESKNVICMEEMNTMMLASACLWHGWPLLVSNLLTCCVPPVHTDEEEETSISVEQYINGMGKEVYMFRKFGKTFAGTNFALAAKEIFSKHGALLFAAARAGQVLLFPGSRFVINPEDKGFLIADDSSVVDEISEPPKSFFNMPSTPKLMDRSSTPNSGRKTPKAGNRSKDFRPAPKNLQGFRFKGARSLSTSGNVSPMRARVRSASCSEKAPEDTEGGVATGSEEEKESEPALAPNNGGIYPTRAVSGLKMSKSHRESQSRRSSNMSIEIEDLDTIDIGMDEDDKDNRTSNLRGFLTRKLSCKPRVGKLSPSRRRSKRIYSEDHKRIQTGHIVLIVHQLDGSMPIFVDFIRSSHFRHLIGCRQVVVICPTLTTTPPRMKAYCEKHSIVLIRADPHRDGMAKARVKSASVVVITNPGHHKSGWPDNEDTAEAMANTETLSILVELLAYAGSSARFVIELSDVAYLNQVGILGARVAETKKNRRKSILKTTRKKSRIQILKDEVSMFTHRQASKKLQNFGVMQIGEGDVVLSNVSELLLAQTLFNENIVDVVSAMLSYTIFEDTLISLCQIQLPSSCTGKEPRTFGYLFSYILETYDALALGIYRIERNDDGTEGFLVITCPSEDFVLRPQDEVFVFCDVAMLEDDSVNNPAVMDDEFSRFSDVMQDDGLTSSDDDKPDAFPAENRTRSSLPQKTQRTLEALNERQTNLELQLGSFMCDVSMALEGIQSSIDQLNSKKQKFGLRSRTKSNVQHN